jgi:hypothetical protein
MIFGWFKSKYLRDKDKSEIAGIRAKFSDRAKNVIAARVHSSALSKRDSQHWRRIVRKL